MIPLLNSTFDLLKLITSRLSPDALPIMHKVVLEMRILFQQHLPEETWACWAMTSDGRSFLRDRNRGPGLPGWDDEQVQLSCGNGLAEKLRERVMAILVMFDRDAHIPHDRDDIPLQSGTSDVGRDISYLDVFDDDSFSEETSSYLCDICEDDEEMPPESENCSELISENGPEMICDSTNEATPFTENSQGDFRRFVFVVAR